MPDILLRNAEGQPFMRLNAPEGSTPEQVELAAQQALAEAQAGASQVSVERTVQNVGSALELGSGVATEVAKQSALPTLGAATGPLIATALLGGGPLGATAGVAAAGTFGLLGDVATRHLRGQPPMTWVDKLLSFAFSAAPEVGLATYLDPRRVDKLTKGLAEVTGAARFGEAAEAGGRLRRDVTRLRSQIQREEQQLFNAVRQKADRLGLRGVLDEDVIPSLEAAAKELQGVKGGEVLATRLRDLARRAGTDDPFVGVKEAEPISFSALSELNRDLTSFSPAISQQLGVKTHGSAVWRLRGALKAKMSDLAAGTPVADALERADNFLVNETRVMKRALRAVDNADPESVVATIATKPGKLSRIATRLEPEALDDLRAAYFKGLLDDTADLAGIARPELIAEQWASLPIKSRQILSGGAPKEVTQLMEQLGALVMQQKVTSQFRLAQAATLSIGVGAVAQGLREGDVGGGLAAMLGTGVGIMIFSRIVSSPPLRRLFIEGVSLKGRAGGRLLAHAVLRSAHELGVPEAVLNTLVAEAESARPVTAEPALGQQPQRLLGGS
jgi:hypothetical protein